MHKKVKPLEAILLIGPTGSGKTPLGDYIQQKGINNRRCHHFDFGHELRTLAGADELPEGFTPYEHNFIRDVLEKGLLLEDGHFYLAEKILLRFVSVRGHRESDLIILNGLPRHEGQATAMSAVVNISHLLILECSAGDVCLRIELNLGGDRTDRTDDAEEMVRKKLEIFSARTAPLIEHYRTRGCSIVTASSGPDTSPAAILDIFLSSMPA